MYTLELNPSWENSMGLFLPGPDIFKYLTDAKTVGHVDGPSCGFACLRTAGCIGKHVYKKHQGILC
jgi:hypothetical protein